MGDTRQERGPPSKSQDRLVVGSLSSADQLGGKWGIHLNHHVKWKECDELMIIHWIYKGVCFSSQIHYAISQLQQSSAELSGSVAGR